MNLIRRINLKIYYVLCNRFLPRKKSILPRVLTDSKNIFIYFDYEREFGGHNTNISDYDISTILDLLKLVKLRATWFTVGKIFDHYPETIIEILSSGHEIGSHTHNHLTPLGTSAKILKNDFKTFSNKTRIIDIRGFHSPRGRWSFSLLKHLRLHNYSYDVIGANKKERLIPYMVGHGKNQLIRLHTVGDDWPLYNKNLKKEDILRYFNSHLNRIKPGEIAGIGFHPWILFSEPNILTSFSEFLTYLNKQENIRLETGSFYADLLLSEQEGLQR